MFIKICGITRLEDAQAALDYGADAVGFIFAESSRKVTVNQAAKIVAQLDGILTVGVFRNHSEAFISEVANTVGLKAVQLHGQESPALALAVQQHIPTVIKAFSHADTALQNVQEYGDIITMVDSPTPGSGVPFDWDSFTAPSKKFILSGGLQPSNVAVAIEKVKPWGIDVASGVESAPGIKDPAKIRAFIENARKS